MSYSKKNQQAKEVFAVVGPDGIMWSRGGSSSSPKLMVYATEAAAERALKSPWTKQVITIPVEIKRIYPPYAPGPETCKKCGNDKEPGRTLPYDTCDCPPEDKTG